MHKLNPVALTIALIALTSVPLSSAHADFPSVAEIAQGVVTALNPGMQAIVKAIDAGSVSRAASQNQADIQAQANQEVEDAKKIAADQEARVRAAAEKDNQAFLDAMQKYRPNITDCNTATSSVLQSYNQQTSAQRVTTVTQAMGDMRNNGVPGGTAAYQARTAGGIQEARRENNIAREVNPAIAVQRCPTPDCYNTVLQNRIKLAMAASVADKAPWNAKGNPQLNQYFTERARWETEASAAQTTVEKLAPKLLKNLDYYKQALADYTDHGLSADVLESQYPNSSKIGLSLYELQEAEFFALTSAGQSLYAIGMNDSERARAAQVLQTHVAQLQIAKIERDELEKAFNILKIPAPAVSASALSVQ